MVRSLLRKTLLCGAMVVVGWPVAMAPAEAAVYRGKFTPDYGDPFPDLYWNGTVEVFAPDACVPASADSISLLSCADIEITSAVVNLYKKKTGPSPTYDPADILQTMNFGTAAGSQLNGLNWLLSFGNGEQLVGVNSTAFPAIQGTIDETIPVSDVLPDERAWFSLQFLGNYAQLYWFDKAPGDALGLIPDEVVLSAGATFTVEGFLGSRTITVGGVCRDNGVIPVPGPLRPFVEPDYCGWSDPDLISPGAFITFERVADVAVPEPATLTLVPMALSAMGLAGLLAQRRRRQATA